MVYLVSDLHGYSIEDIKKKFAEIGFCEKDRLYMLGDCIDRGKDGINIIKWISVVLITMICSYLIYLVTEKHTDSVKSLLKQKCNIT
jgi:hypothetical protein